MQQISVKAKDEREGQEFKNVVKSGEGRAQPASLRILSSSKLLLTF